VSEGPSGGRRLGYLEAIVAACLWGSSGIFAVHLFRMGMPPRSVALLRPVVGVLVLVAVFGVLRPASLRVSYTGLLVLGLGGGVAVGIFQLAYQLSTDAVGVPATVALLYLAPAVVAAAAGPLLGEWPTRTRATLVVVTLVGVCLSVAGAYDVPAAFGSAGLAWGALAGLSYAAYTLLGRFASPRYGSVPTVVYSTIGACVILTATLLSTEGAIELPATGTAWVLILVFGVTTIALAQFLFFDALARIEASRASLATAIEPVVAAVLATVLLDQGLRSVGWLGIVLVVAGVAGVGITGRRAGL
jgi:DME family drug/metabolite transporter